MPPGEAGVLGLLVRRSQFAIDPPLRLVHCCCCSRCFIMLQSSTPTSRSGTRARSSICMYVPSHLPTCIYYQGTPRIPNIFDSLRLESAYRRGKQRCWVCSRGGSRRCVACCSHVHTPPCARAHTVCCCRICFEVRLNSTGTSRHGTRASSRQ